MIRRPPRSTLDRSSAASDVYKRQPLPVLVANAATCSQTGGRRQDGAARATRRGAARQARHPTCLLYTSPSPRDRTRSRMPSSA